MSPSEAPLSEGTVQPKPADPVPWWVTQPPLEKKPAPAAPADPAPRAPEQAPPTAVTPPPAPAPRAPDRPTALSPRGLLWRLAAGGIALLVLICGALILATPPRERETPEVALEKPTAKLPAPEREQRRERPLPPAVEEVEEDEPAPEPGPEPKAEPGPALKFGPELPALAGRGKVAPKDAEGLVGVGRGRPVAVVEKVPVPVVAEPRRLQRATEDELRQQLADAPEVGIGNAGTTIVSAYAANVRASKAGAAGLTDVSPLLRVRPDLQTLPLKQGASCQLGPKAAINLELLSRKLRLYLNAVAPPGALASGANPDRLREALRQGRRGKRPEWLRVEAVPTLMQMLIHEDAAVRKVLVDLLSEVPQKKATVALAQRAVFDLSPEVRLAATRALKGRKAEDYRPVLLKALRHPWGPAAEHAAEAIVELRDRATIPHLIGTLKEPDPAGPKTLRTKYTVVKEVVRINHLNNCLLCHPPAVAGGEPVPGVDPVVSMTVPATPQAAALIARLQGIATGGGGHDYANRATSTAGLTGGGRGRGPRLVPVQIPVVVRADITFVRQDFSVQLRSTPAVAFPVARPLGRTPAAPTGVRFDYVVRTRVLTPKEAAERRAAAKERPGYPQRDAALYALRELTGKDAGTTAEGWTTWWDTTGKLTVAR